MLNRMLGNNLKVSSLGLGCMGLSHGYGAPTEHHQSIKLIRNAYETGYTLFDTAECYGTSDDPNANERLVGEAVKPFRNQIQLVTKFGIYFNAKLDYRTKMPQFTPQAVDKNQALLGLLSQMAEKKNATPGQISLAWMLCKKPYIVPIPGTTKIERLKENAVATDVLLSSLEIQLLDNALDRMEMSAVFGGSRVIK